MPQQQRQTKKAQKTNRPPYRGLAALLLLILLSYYLSTHYSASNYQGKPAEDSKLEAATSYQGNKGGNKNEHIIDSKHLQTNTKTESRQAQATSPAAASTQQHINDAGLSLSGTEVEPLSLGRDEQGWVLSPQLRYYFEYFIQLQGELDLEAIKQLLKSDLNQQHPAKQADYLFELFERYLDYLSTVDQQLLSEHDLSEANADAADPDIDSNDTENSNTASQQHLDELNRLALSELKEQQREIQLRYFNERERTALFDDDYLDAFDDTQTLQSKVKQYQQVKNSLDPVQLNEARIELFGLQASERLSQLDQQRSRWQERLERYVCEKQQLQDIEGLSNQDRRLQLGLLLNRHFSASEARRVQALERNQLINVSSCD
jgi:lipase chaperone LimK